jgi:hypothetical protein
MAYDLHAVRSVHWTDASVAPITKREIDAIVEGDPELTWSCSDFVEMKDQTGVVTVFYMILWNGIPCFWWYRDQLLSSSPDQKQLTKLIRIATALDARVVGDDGERYELRRSIFGKEKVARLDA